MNKLIGKFLSFFYPKKIILMVDGGFCSQLHKYFIGLYLKKHFNVHVEYCLTWFKENGKSVGSKMNRQFTLLDVYPNINFPIAHENEIKFFRKYFMNSNSEYFSFTPQSLKNSLPAYFDGYYNHWKFYDSIKEDMFKDLEFNPKLSTANSLILEQIKNTPNSIALHVRRGDYVDANMIVLDENYYLNAIKLMNEKLNNQAHFFIFSDGFDWVEKNILPHLKESDYTLVKENDNDAGYYDFYLITQCKHQISSNSSFGYMGAILNKNPNKIVITPKRWFPSIDVKDAYAYPGFIILDEKEKYNKS